MGRREALIVLAVASISGCAHSPRPEESAPRYQSYFDARENYDAFYVSARSVDVEHRVRGIIVPHHLIVGEHIAALYESIAHRPPSIVAIIGPDHRGVAKAPVVTTNLGYDTPYGPLDVDDTVAQAIAHLPFAAMDERAFIYEHSINSQTAFVRRSFGKVPIVPIMIHANTTLDEAEAVARALHSSLPDDALVIASVDFSHYLPLHVANFHDRISASVVDTFDIEQLPRIEVDSPISLAALQMYLTMRNARTVAYRDHTNSATAVGDPGIKETTSHIFRAFADGPPSTGGGVGIVLYGDSMFDRGIRTAADRRGKESLLNDIAPEERFFIGHHLSVLNLESPVTEAPGVAKDIVLRSDPHLARSVLNRLNVDVLSFNNNHVYDAGTQGVGETIAFARENDMDILTPDEPCNDFVFSDRTVALCSFDDSRTSTDIEPVERIIAERSREVDWLVVSIHWGREYEREASNRQRLIAKKLVAAGADAIVGHGPHVIQSTKCVGGAPVAYSLGNFLFDQFDAPMNTGIILGLYLDDDVAEATPIPFVNNMGKLSLVSYDMTNGAPIVCTPTAAASDTPRRGDHP